MAVHYIWYDKLYFQEDNEKKKKRLLRRLGRGKPVYDIYLLALPESKERNILDIYNSLELIQPHYKGRDKYIVGLAHGKENAVELAAAIVGEMYNKNKNFDIRTFLDFRENSFSGREG